MGRFGKDAYKGSAGAIGEGGKRKVKVKIRAKNTKQMFKQANKSANRIKTYKIKFPFIIS